MSENKSQSEMKSETPATYAAKLKAIEDELENMELEDFPTDIVESLEGEARAEQREFLQEQLEEQLEQLDWDQDGDAVDEARSIFRDHLIDERFTPEEKAAYQADLHAQEIEDAKRFVVEAQAMLAKNEAEIARAREQNKPKMLANEERVSEGRIRDLERARQELESLIAAGPANLNAARSEELEFKTEVSFRTLLRNEDDDVAVSIVARDVTDPRQPVPVPLSAVGSLGEVEDIDDSINLEFCTEKEPPPNATPEEIAECKKTPLLVKVKIDLPERAVGHGVSNFISDIIEKAKKAAKQAA